MPYSVTYMIMMIYILIYSNVQLGVCIFIIPVFVRQNVSGPAFSTADENAAYYIRIIIYDNESRIRRKRREIRDFM
jgi:hypothetical protein